MGYMLLTVYSNGRINIRFETGATSRGRGDIYTQETSPVYETTSLEGINKTVGFSAGSNARLIGTHKYIPV